jgi:hypothetical protein
MDMDDGVRVASTYEMVASTYERIVEGWPAIESAQRARLAEGDDDNTTKESPSRRGLVGTIPIHTNGKENGKVRHRRVGRKK